MRILLLEDDHLVAESISRFLRTRGYHVAVLYSPEEVFQTFSSFHPTVFVLDKNLGAFCGLEIVRTLRKSAFAATPVIMITGHDSLEQKLEGFATGVDDYLVKPFEFLELEARILAVYRRSAPRHFDDGWLRISPRDREFVRDGIAIPLSQSQWIALSLLIERSPNEVSREEVGAAIWGGNHRHDSRSIDRLIARLRSLIEPNTKSPKYIHAIRGAGYRFDPKPKG